MYSIKFLCRIKLASQYLELRSGYQLSPSTFGLLSEVRRLGLAHLRAFHFSELVVALTEFSASETTNLRNVIEKDWKVEQRQGAVSPE